jgi:hypothetical protein
MQKVRAELSEVLTFGFFTRIILVSSLLALAICYWVEKAAGPLDFNWLRAIAISVVSGIGVLLVGVATTCIPPNVRVSAKGIDILKAQGAFRAQFSDLVTISIQASVPPVLTFRKGNRDYQYAVAESVDLNQLRKELERLSGRSIQIEQTGQRCAPPEFRALNR